jgi:galactokinase
MATNPRALRDSLIEAAPEVGHDAGRIRVVRAPGRVNLIGEHTDYNNGFVLPVAIDLGISIAFVPTAERCVDLRLAGSAERAVIDLDAPFAGDPDRPRWADYVGGMVASLRDAGASIGGFIGVLDADLPREAGLSSSAALEVAVAWALGGGAPPLADPMALAQAAQRGENEYVGVPCGLMDPFAVVFGVAGSAVLLDCQTLEHRAVALLPRAALVIVDSGIPRGLRTSAYAERRAQCEEAVAILFRSESGVAGLRNVSLRSASLDLVEANREELGDRLYRRARHVVTENARVLGTVAALERGNIAAAGQLLLASHASLRDDFEVSLAPIDRLVELTAGLPGVYGSRLTGGGFGGATISLVREDAVDEVIESIRHGYRTPAGDAPDVRRVVASAGAGLVELDP